jgi:hypothetical protein
MYLIDFGTISSKMPSILSLQATKVSPFNQEKKITFWPLISRKVKMI